MHDEDAAVPEIFAGSEITLRRLCVRLFHEAGDIGGLRTGNSRPVLDITIIRFRRRRYDAESHQPACGGERQSLRNRVAKTLEMHDYVIGGHDHQHRIAVGGMVAVDSG